MTAPLLLLLLAAVVPAPPPPPPPAWAGLIGEYGENILILEKNGKLYDGAAPLTETAPGSFETPAHGKVLFTKNAVTIDGHTYRRKIIPGENGGVFRVPATRPVAELKKAALALEPPAETGDFRKPELVEVVRLDPTIKTEIRYATPDNFMSTPFYSQARAFLQRPAAEAVVRAHKELHQYGFGILIHDAYRPWYVTKMFWDGTSTANHNFVADPQKGSRHNRGCAVDLTMYDLKTGQAVRMTGGYDEFSDRSFAHYTGGTSLQRWRRDLLRQVMEQNGFTVNPKEWWHFDYKDWDKYPILNVTFEKL